METLDWLDEPDAKRTKPVLNGRRHRADDVAFDQRTRFRFPKRLGQHLFGMPGRLR